MMPSTFPHNPTYTCTREFVHGWKEIGRSLSLQYGDGHVARAWYLWEGPTLSEGKANCRIAHVAAVQGLLCLLEILGISICPFKGLQDAGPSQMVPTRWTAADEPESAEHFLLLLNMQIMKYYIIIHNTSILCQSDVQVAPCAGFLGNISESKCSHVLPPSELHHQLIGLEGTL